VTILLVYDTERDGRELVRYLSRYFGGASIVQIPLAVARLKPLMLQAQAAAADFILTVAVVEEEVRLLSAEVVDVLSLPRMVGSA
jgi:hypothetical protein